MALFILLAGGLVFLLQLTCPVSCRALATDDGTPIQESGSPLFERMVEATENPDPSYFLSYVHEPSSEDIYINQLSKGFLGVTKDLVSFSPRSKTTSLEDRLTSLKGLSPSEAAAFLEHQGLTVPPPKPIICDHNTPFYRTLDGSCNNLQHPCWGKAHEPFQRWLPPAYANGVDAPRVRADGAPLPCPRQVYQWVSSQWQQNSTTTYSHFSSLGVIWGQMLAHEMVLTPTVTVKVWNGAEFSDAPPSCCDPDTSHPECIPIVIDYEDSFFPRGHCINIARSAAFVYSPTSCTPFRLGVPRNQMNQLTAFMDASLVYGASMKQMRKLRENGGVGARLVMDFSTGWSHPPRKNRTCKAGHGVCDKRCFLAGERRANENPFLGAMHMMWAREHNRLVNELSSRGWPEETLFHVVRKIVGALFQHITYNEYLPYVMGPELMKHMRLAVPTPNYRYDSTLNPTIFNAFAAAAFRYGHSMIASRYSRMGQPESSSQPLSGDFFSMDEFCSPHGDPVVNLLGGMSQQRAQKIDNLFSRQVTNHLFAKEMNGPGLDLFSINVQRGRDHGLPPYTKWREACNLPKIKDYPDLKGTIPDHIIDRLATIYGPGGVHEVDLFVAGVSELPVNGGIVGPTFTCIVSHQYKALKFGDRFWYENLHHPGAFTPAQLEVIRRTTLASLLCRNSEIKEMQALAFEVAATTNPKIPCHTILQQTHLDLKFWT
ncbi:peroxidasin [Caerostris extrusa]|uniref:Peroxidasin n=1 Tax=Caerostris extrusa TaxID=172846 RepID=A0AAV4PAG5_CAEEX|nr:peroxidasin [Caerostris extrusa]